MSRITYLPQAHVKDDGTPHYDEERLKLLGIEPHEKEKLEALGIKPSHDLLETKVGAITFKAGEPVLVDESAHMAPFTLMNNPWFKVEKVDDQPPATAAPQEPAPAVVTEAPPGLAPEPPTEGGVQ